MVLVRSSPDRVVRVRALVGDSVLSTWARLSTHSAELKVSARVQNADFRNL